MDTRGLLTQWILGSMITLSLVGIADAGYLSYARITNSSISCRFLEGCNTVAASPQSVLFGIVPLSYLGVLFYLIIFVLAMWLVLKKTDAAKNLLLFVTTLGFLSSLYFLYVQKFIIEAFCIYCLISAALSTLLFILALMYARYYH